MKIRTIIVDDEQVARARLIRLLHSADDIEVIAECANGPSAIAAVREHAPDLVLLDIQMPGMDGFDVLDALQGGRMPLAIFVTAYDEYAIRAFEACALDYLLKPVAPERLMKALGRVAERLREAARGEMRPAESRLIVRNQGRIDVVAASQIEWIEAAGNYAILHTGSQNHIVRQTMGSLEMKLTGEFLRASRSAILNLRRITQLGVDPSGENFAIMQSGQRVAFTRRISEVRQQLKSLAADRGN